MVEHGYDKEKLKKRLHRVEGQVRGIERMVDDDRYCIDVLTQIGAVRTALESIGFELLNDHVTHCVSDALAAGRREDRDGEEPGAAVRGRALREDALTRTANARRRGHAAIRRRARSRAAAPGRATCAQDGSRMTPSGAFRFARGGDPGRNRAKSDAVRPESRFGCGAA